MAQSFWPGQRSRTNVQPETTSDDLWREIGRLAETASDFATQIYVKQAQDQYSTSEIQIKVAEAELATALGNEQDESKFEAILKKHKANVNKFMPKNPLAAKGFNLLVANKTISWDKAYKDALNDRLSEKLEVKFDIALKELESTGDEKMAVKLGLSGVALYNWDESGIRKKLRDATSKALYQKASNAALLNPELILSKAGEKDGKYSIDLPGLEDLTATQAQAVRSIAEGQRNYLKRQEDITLSSFYTDVSQKAEDGMSIGDMQTLILNQPGLTTKERQKAMTVFSSAYNTWDTGGTKQDAWKTTQDPMALLRMQIKISAGKPMTELDIIDAQMAQPEKGPLFSNIDRDKLFNQLPDNKDPIMKTTFAEEWGTIAYNIYATEEVEGTEKKVIPEDDLPEYQATNDAIVAIIKKNGTDFAKSQKEIKEVLAPIRKERARGTLSKIWGFVTTTPLGVTPLGAAIEITGMQRQLSEARKQSGE